MKQKPFPLKSIYTLNGEVYYIYTQQEHTYKLYQI